MRIDRLTLTEFKCFEHLTCEFQPGVNLIIGGNGSGKTAILEALAVACGGFFGAQEQKMQRQIKFSEVRILNHLRQDGSTVEATWAEAGLTWSRSIRTATKNNDSKFVKPISEYGERIFTHFNDAGDRTLAPLISYYSTQRLFKEANLSKNQSYDAANGRRNGYLNCLREHSIKSVLEDWLGNAVTKRATLHIKEIEHEDLVLQNVEQSIVMVLREVMGLGEEVNLKIYQDPDFENELCVHLGPDQDYPLSYYSDGFRNIILLVIDLIWRASQLNPWLSFTELQTQTRGVVLIDEIDLHLHYRWQSKVVSVLQRLLPQVQFFITTHSPAVVANFEHGTLFTLHDKQLEQFDGPYFGKKINDVLRDVLGASERHLPTQRRINALFYAIDEGRAHDYLQLLAELTELLGEADPELYRARMIINFAQQEGKGHAVHQ